MAAATPFIGQGESAMLIKPFVPHLTKAEIHQVMTCGFATIAGSVLVAYIGMGLNPQALISSCVMSIPASIATSKMRYPEEDESLTAGKIVVPDDEEHKAANFLHSFANGAWLGLKIAGMIMTTLLCIIGFVALVDGILTWLGHYWNLNGEYELTLELIFSYVFYPVAFLLGVPRGPDLRRVGRLIGIKVIVVSLRFLFIVNVSNTNRRRTSSLPTISCLPKSTRLSYLLERRSSRLTAFAALEILAPLVHRLACFLRLPQAGLEMLRGWRSARFLLACSVH